MKSRELSSKTFLFKFILFIIMQFNYKIEPLTKQDLKEVSLNYLKSVIKNTDDKQLINNCKLEIKRRTTRSPIN